MTCKFDYFRNNFSTFEYRILYRTSSAKLPDVRKYRIYSGLNSNLEKNPFRLSRNRKIRKKNPFALPYHDHLGSVENCQNTRDQLLDKFFISNHHTQLFVCWSKWIFTTRWWLNESRKKSKKQNIGDIKVWPSHGHGSKRFFLGQNNEALNIRRVN